MRWLICAFVCMNLFHAAENKLSAGEGGYYMLLLGSQGPGLSTEAVHTFACFIKVEGCSTSCQESRLIVHTISWLPETMEIKVCRAQPEPGHNFDLHKSLRWAQGHGAHLKQWGPYAIKKLTYFRAMQRINDLNHDRLTYRALDTMFREEVTNCIHAVSWIDPKADRHQFPMVRVGFSASQHIANVFYTDDLMINPDCVHSWLNSRLGLDGYCMEQGAVRFNLQRRVSQVLTNREKEPFCFSGPMPPPDFVVPPGYSHCETALAPKKNCALTTR